MSKTDLPRAVLVGVKLPDVLEHEFSSSLAELERLVETLGYRVVDEVTQVRQNLSPNAVLGEGKLQELADLTGGSGQTGTTPRQKKDKARLRREREGQGDGEESKESEESDSDSEFEGTENKRKVDLVAVDHELSPSQLRNLERATGAAVLDRTGVIIEIFHRRAKSREARLQVEIARLSYTAPRVREAPGGKERQAGRGAGEAAIELDRRRIRDRIAELREQLDAIVREQSVRRAQRRQARRVALVGYTNAGKSSLMRALTLSDVYVEDKLFATLDTTVRALQPEVRPRILLSDTVGFIKKLPHDLVASFRSTLDEALEASLILHVVDASDPDWENQLSVTHDVLSEIGAQDELSVLVMNKIDKLTPEALHELEQRSFEQGTKVWFVSAHRPDEVARLHQRIVEWFEASYVEVELAVPFQKQRLVSFMHENARVLSETYDESGAVVRLRSDPETIAKLKAELEEA